MARPRSDIRGRVLEAARSRFLEEGVDGAALRAIARDAGTSIGMIYYYFQSKDELFLAVVEETYAGVLADLEVALAPDRPARERIRELYLRIGSLSEAELDIVRLMVREAISSSSRFDKLLERFARGHVPLVLSALVDGIAEGSVTNRVPPGLLLMATFGIGGVPQLARRIAGDRLPLGDVPDGEALADELVALLFSGIGGPSQPA